MHKLCPIIKGTCCADIDNDCWDSCRAWQPINPHDPNSEKACTLVEYPKFRESVTDNLEDALKNVINNVI